MNEAEVVRNLHKLYKAVVHLTKMLENLMDHLGIEAPK